tara:strand:- start:677 stop:1771 length:1095 start_codon:yes stop_codon:yes gene_type:complete
MHIAFFETATPTIRRTQLQTMIDGTYNPAKYFSKMEEDYEGNSQLTQPHVFSNLVEMLSADSHEPFASPWIQPCRSQSVNCTNQTVFQSAIHSNNARDLDETTLTLSHILLNVLKGREDSCYSCTKDHNDYTLKEHLKIMYSETHSQPRCVLMPNPASTKMGFVLDMGWHLDAFYIKKVQLHPKMEKSFKLYLSKIRALSGKEIESLGKIINTEVNISKRHITLKIPNARNVTDSLSDLATLGYITTLKISKKHNTETQKYFTEIIDGILRLKNLSEQACNPLTIRTVQAMLKIDNQLGNTDQNQKPWPIDYLAIGDEMLTEVQRQISIKGADIKGMNDMLWKIDDHLDADQICIAISPVHFWV